MEINKKQKAKGRTVILPMYCKGNSRGKWIDWLETNSKDKAGPFPNILEQREKWGNASLIVRAGKFIYLVMKRDSHKPLPWE